MNRAPGPILIALTEQQVEQLSEHYAHVEAEFQRGRRGMLVAQVGASQDGGHRLMRVGFIPHDDARAIAVEKAMGSVQ